MSEQEPLTDFEQMLESTTQIASLIRAYFEALKESGFTEDQAMYLTGQFQEAIVARNK